MNQPKVVALTPPRRSKVTVPPILHSVRQHAKGKLNELMQELFNNIDDALFEMADRSRSDTEQSMYFSSMREIRLQRKDIFKEFMQAFYRGFEQAFTEDVTAEKPADHETTGDNFSLLHNDELEISVAITGMTSKVTSQHSLSIMQLTKRIDHLSEVTDVTERLNPLGPEKLSLAFVQATEGVELDIKIRIILLKLYERFVLERLAPVYDEANQLLADAGVLPDLKDMLSLGADGGRQSASARSPREGNNTPSADPGDDADTEPNRSRSGGYTIPAASFSAIQNLLATARGGRSRRTKTNGPSISTTDLLSVLSAAQADLLSPINISEIPTLLDLQQLVVNRAPEITGGKPGGMHQADDDVVNFVGMLFDYILNDRNLAIPMKALIGRLQLPIVKLAVIDKSFFELTSHPARQLLNELSSAGIGWSNAKELRRDALYNKIESIVLRVMNSFGEDTTVFADLLRELREFVHKHERKNDQAEQRVKETETGHAKRYAAKNKVQELINHKASGMRLPPDVGRFVSDTWSKVLVYACVTEGEDSGHWQRHVQTLDDLLWSLQPLDNLVDLEKRDAMHDDLLANLAAGMVHLQMPERDRETHSQLLVQHLQDIAKNDRAFLEDDEAPRTDDTFEEMEEIILATPPQALESDVNIQIEPEFLQKIEALSEGVWVELVQENNEKLRCKLSTIVEPGSRHIFVNRRGMKVAEKTRMGLAVELKRGSLTILAESQVFDRALQAVISNLRKMHSTSVTAQ